MNTREIHSGIWIDKNKGLVVQIDPYKSIIIPVFFHLEKKGFLINTSKPKKGYNKFFSEIVNVLPNPDNILILGPDQTKFMLKDYLEAKEGKVHYIHSQVAGHMSTLDIVSTVRNHFYPGDQKGNDSQSPHSTVPQ
jgi:stalled ribosome rescue protein Dom34